jgi:hypothetical protein
MFASGMGATKIRGVCIEQHHIRRESIGLAFLTI